MRGDKLHEVKAGHDGTWAAHPGLISLVVEVFDSNMPHANQLDVKREDVQVMSICCRNPVKISSDLQAATNC